MGDSAQYSLTLDGQQVTVGWDELVTMVADGRVGPEMTLTSEFGATVQARNVPGLFPTITPPLQAPPPTYPSHAAAPPAKSSFPIWAIVLIAVCVVCVCGVGVLGALLFPVFAQAKQAALRAAEVANFQQIGLGAIMYSSDFDDKFPPRMESAAAVEPYIETYTKNPKIFVDLNPLGSQIQGDQRLDAINNTKVAQPASVFMFFEDRDWENGKFAAVWVDGHAKLTTRDELNRDLSSPIAGLSK